MLNLREEYQKLELRQGAFLKKSEKIFNATFFKIIQIIIMGNTVTALF